MVLARLRSGLNSVDVFVSYVYLVPGSITIKSITDASKVHFSKQFSRYRYAFLQKVNMIFCIIN